MPEECFNRKREKKEKEKNIGLRSIVIMRNHVISLVTIMVKSSSFSICEKNLWKNNQTSFRDLF